jgi:hypothetical protein
VLHERRLLTGYFPSHFAGDFQCKSYSSRYAAPPVEPLEEMIEVMQKFLHQASATGASPGSASKFADVWSSSRSGINPSATGRLRRFVTLPARIDSGFGGRTAMLGAALLVVLKDWVTETKEASWRCDSARTRPSDS